MFIRSERGSSNLSILFQVILHSEINAAITIYDAWIDLQDGFVHTGKGDGRPTSGFFPLVISPTSRSGILFSIRLGKTNAEGIHACITTVGIFLISKTRVHTNKCMSF